MQTIAWILIIQKLLIVLPKVILFPRRWHDELQDEDRTNIVLKYVSENTKTYVRMADKSDKSKPAVQRLLQNNK